MCLTLYKGSGDSKSGPHGLMPITYLLSLLSCPNYLVQSVFLAYHLTYHIFRINVSYAPVENCMVITTQTLLSVVQSKTEDNHPLWQTLLYSMTFQNLGWNRQFIGGPYSQYCHQESYPRMSDSDQHERRIDTRWIKKRGQMLLVRKHRT